MTTIELTGLRGITRKIKLLRDTPFARPMLAEIGMFAMRSIKKRTLKGEDVHEVAFKPYSAIYAKQRAKAGFPVRPVDLTRTGSMLSAMTFDTNINSVDIFFINTTDPSGSRNPAKAFFLQKEREFFALSEKDNKGIIQIVNNYYKKFMR